MRILMMVVLAIATAFQRSANALAPTAGPAHPCNKDRPSPLTLHRENIMSEIREHMKIIGKDGAPVGTVDRVEGNRIKLTRKDSPEGHKDHHHYIDTKYVGAVEGDVVKLSLNADAVPKSEAA
jgi:hypothetical protein